MDLQQKIGIAGKAVESISRHDDEEAGVRLAALDAVQAKLDEERAAIAARISARLGELGLAKPSGS